MKTIKCRPIFIENNNNLKYLNNESSIIIDNIKYELIIISLDHQNIEDRDIVYNNKTKRIELFKYMKNTCEEIFCNKIIATQSQILKVYIEQFVEQYKINEIKDIWIEMVLTYDLIIVKNVLTASTTLKPKLLDGFITIAEFQFTNIGKDENGLSLGNCIRCNAKGVIIDRHKCHLNN